MTSIYVITIVVLLFNHLGHGLTCPHHDYLQEVDPGQSWSAMHTHTPPCLHAKHIRLESSTMILCVQLLFPYVCGETQSPYHAGRPLQVAFHERKMLSLTHLTL